MNTSRQVQYRQTYRVSTFQLSIQKSTTSTEQLQIPTEMNSLFWKETNSKLSSSIRRKLVNNSSSTIFYDNFFVFSNKYFFNFGCAHVQLFNGCFAPTIVKKNCIHSGKLDITMIVKYCILYLPWCLQCCDTSCTLRMYCGEENSLHGHFQNRPFFSLSIYLSISTHPYCYQLNRP